MPSWSAFHRGLLIAASVGIPALASSQTATPPGASAYIISPKDGDTVASPFKVQFGLTGMASRRPASTSRRPAIITSSSTPRFRPRN